MTLNVRKFQLRAGNSKSEFLTRPLMTFGKPGWFGFPRNDAALRVYNGPNNKQWSLPVRVNQ